MVKAIIFLSLLLTGVIFLAALLINAVRWAVTSIRNKDSKHISTVIKKNLILFMGIAIFMTACIFVTQIMAYTPAIKDSEGKTVEGSIAELRKVNVNGHNEWISIRGKDKNAPVLLFLAGGPGGTQMAATRYELAKLEDNFVVVSWDQPGSGKSCGCMWPSHITPMTYVQDGIALTEYLKEQFGQEKIYMMGESWGSALGIFIIKEKPEYYAGFIGTGQMVNFKESEIRDYHKAIEIAEEKGDEKKVRDLVSLGEPPYYDGIIAMKSGSYLNYLSTYMASDPEITNGGYNTLRDMFSQEYGLLDSINFFGGLVTTFNAVYPNLYETDLRKDYAHLDVPVYFFIGRHDINAPTDLAEDYYNILDAPQKKLVWFEHSGHSPWINETDLFVKETLKAFKG